MYCEWYEIVFGKNGKFLLPFCKRFLSELKNTCEHKIEPALLSTTSLFLIYLFNLLWRWLSWTFPILCILKNKRNIIYYNQSNEAKLKGTIKTNVTLFGLQKENIKVLWTP